VDALAALAEAAELKGYTLPEVNEDPVMRSWTEAP